MWQKLVLNFFSRPIRRIYQFSLLTVLYNLIFPIIDTHICPFETQYDN